MKKNTKNNKSKEGEGKGGEEGEEEEEEEEEQQREIWLAGKGISLTENEFDKLLSVASDLKNKMKQLKRKKKRN